MTHTFHRDILKVRTGEGSKPPLRGGKVEGTSAAVTTEVEAILAEMNGEVGLRKRRNLEVLRERCLGALAPGGEVDVDMRGLLEFSKERKPRNE